MLVTQEYSTYKNAIDKSRSQVHELFTTADSRFLPPPLKCNMPPVSNPITVHYSFDFAQQVHYPSDPLQPGPIYFLTPRKASLFGVCCEAIPRQVNFVIDEASDTGKGALSACWTISANITVLLRPQSICMLTTAVAKSTTRDTENLARSCQACQAMKRAPPVVLLHPWVWPSKPWQRVHLDFASPVDAHSKCPEVKVMSSTTVPATLDVLREWFSVHGIPEQLVTDNLPLTPSRSSLRVMEFAT